MYSMLQSEHFEFGHNSTITKGRQETKLLWLPVVFCLPLTYWELVPGGTVGAPALMFTPHEEKTQRLFPTHVTVPEDIPTAVRSWPPQPPACVNEDGRSRVYCLHHCLPKIRTKPDIYRGLKLYLSTE